MAACSSHDPRAARPRPVFSPNGELLSGGGKDAPKCPEVLGSWWDKIAAAHSGQLNKETFFADTNSQFDAMDLDHDGFITPAELSEYRSTIEDEPAYEEVPSPDQQVQAADAKARRGRRAGDPPASAPPRRYRDMSPDVVDPVMSADKDLTFKVTREAFMAQAREVFAEIDKNHDGLLSREELVNSCPVVR